MEQRLGDILLELGLVDQQGLDAALRRKAKLGGRIGEHLVAAGAVSEEDLLRGLARQRHVPFADETLFTKLDARLRRLVPRSKAFHYRIVPVRYIDGQLILATCESGNLERVRELVDALGHKVRLVLASRKHLEEAIARLYAVDSSSFTDVAEPPRPARHRASRGHRPKGPRLGGSHRAAAEELDGATMADKPPGRRSSRAGAGDQSEEERIAREVESELPQNSGVFKLAQETIERLQRAREKAISVERGSDTVVASPRGTMIEPVPESEKTVLDSEIARRMRDRHGDQPVPGDRGSGAFTGFFEDSSAVFSGEEADPTRASPPPVLPPGRQRRASPHVEISEVFERRPEESGVTMIEAPRSLVRLEEETDDEDTGLVGPGEVSRSPEQVGEFVEPTDEHDALPDAPPTIEISTAPEPSPEPAPTPTPEPMIRPVPTPEPATEPPAVAEVPRPAKPVPPPRSRSKRAKPWASDPEDAPTAPKPAAKRAAPRLPDHVDSVAEPLPPDEIHDVLTAPPTKAIPPIAAKVTITPHPPAEAPSTARTLPPPVNPPPVTASESAPSFAPSTAVPGLIPGGERFGNYVLHRKVKTGGMAVVYEAHTHGLEGVRRQVAIKRILPNLTDSEEFVTMFIDEAKIMVQLSHASIGQVYELGKVEDSYFIAMEYIDGRDLNAIFVDAVNRGEPIPIPLATYLTQRVLEGLDYAHRKCDLNGNSLAIVHRDVSPANILCSFEGAVKIVDFGIAKAVSKVSLTRPGLIKGKISYMSPEQMRGRSIDRRSDIFAAGIVFYELLAGRRLFAGGTDVETIRNVLRGDVPPLRGVRAEIPEDVAATAHRALERDPAKRFQWASEMSQELQRAMVRNNYNNPRGLLTKYMDARFGGTPAGEEGEP